LIIFLGLNAKLASGSGFCEFGILKLKHMALNTFGISVMTCLL